MTLQGPFKGPLTAKISGVEVVTIPLSDYADLLACKRDLAIRIINHANFHKSPRSMIERNPEVAVFIAQRLGIDPVSEIVKACRRKFGKAHTPSPQSVYRYWMKIRRDDKPQQD